MGEPAISALIKALSSESHWVRSGAVGALGEIGELTVSRLIEALGDKSHNVRAGAVWALNQIATPEALKAVAAYQSVENVD